MSAFPSSSVVGAFDVNSIANETYERNHLLRPRAVDLSSLDVPATSRALGYPSAWLLSPPCQPYSRRGKGLGGRDARAWSFPRLFEGLRGVEASARPRLVLVENVMGFERSETRDDVCRALEGMDYAVRELCVSPEDLGVPYSRPRYFLIARKRSERVEEGEAGEKGDEDCGGRVFPSPSPSRPSRSVHRGIPRWSFFEGPGNLVGADGLEGSGNQDCAESTEGSGAPTNANGTESSRSKRPGLDPLCRPLSDYLVAIAGDGKSAGASTRNDRPTPACDGDLYAGPLALPPPPETSPASASLPPAPFPSFVAPLFLTHEQLLKAGWTLDLVTSCSRRVNCIAKSYGHYIKGSGSVLVTRNEEELPNVLRTFPVPSMNGSAERHKGDKASSADARASGAPTASEGTAALTSAGAIGTLAATPTAPDAAATAAIATPTATTATAAVPIAPTAPAPTSAELAAALLSLAPRFLSPREVANLHAFPSSFTFPEDVTVRQRYALLGNSLSVQVVVAVLRWAVPEGTHGGDEAGAA